MKTLGIVGGIGPESTIEYYRFAFAEYRARVPGGSAPPIIINSIDLQKMLTLIDDGQLNEVTRYLGDEVCRLAAAGADFGLLAANTPHIVFDDILRNSPIPLISIVQATCQVAATNGLTKVGIFGIRPTMQGRFYPDVFSQRAIRVIAPKPDEQDYIHHKYKSELLQGHIVPATRGGLLTIAKRMKADDGIEGLILAGTELPPILRDFGEWDLPFLDTTKIHVSAAIDQLLM